ncbi:uncharacterized protein LOC113650930 [Tachysurus fulvidraco]|uniref:uncharacterized protein LOC113650930 n=1 Tax=Tachysurus fulvidraco TaxID=1234273 RepID=UPI001FEFCA22|nr:uncharacterized protein LOC113650930 [Tachysurus fulvidraco]
MSDFRNFPLSPSELSGASIRPYDFYEISEDDDGTSRTLHLQPGLNNCTFTGLVFEVKEEGKVMYKVKPCDMYGMQHMEPAGPLYSIKHVEGSIHRLHLPHCETRTDGVKFIPAQVTGGKVEIFQPVEVTDTHVIIEVKQVPSGFGVLKLYPFSGNPIRAQVLLFYDQSLTKLNIHVLPANVPVEEVQRKHEGMTYISSSACQLTPGKTYRPICRTGDRDYVCQPEEEMFKCDFGPNFRPTFEVFLNSDVNRVTLSLLEGLVVWTPRDVLLPGAGGASNQ